MRQPAMTDTQKQTAVGLFTSGQSTVTKLANGFNVHPRTIYRALEEAGVDYRSQKPTAIQQVMSLMKRHNLTVDQLDAIVTNHKKAATSSVSSGASKVAALFRPVTQTQVGGSGLMSNLPIEGAQPAIRPVRMSLFPSMGSIQDVVDFAKSKLPITDENDLFSLLMTYPNSLLENSLLEASDGG